MLSLQSVRVSSVVLRNILFTSYQKQSFCQSRLIEEDKLNGENATSGNATSRKSQFEPPPETGRLTFTIPGLSPLEETFTKQQIRIVLKPDCMNNKSRERKLKINQIGPK